MKSERRIAHRLLDILDAITDVRDALAGETFDSFVANRMKRAAVERYLEIISEASRHVPKSVQDTEHPLAWRRMADFGNALRHEYHRTNSAILWDIYRNHLPELEVAIRRGLPDYPDVEND